MKNKIFNFFNGKKVLILGFGLEGKSTLEILKNIPCQIGIADKNLVVSDELRGYQLFCGEDYLDSTVGFDVVMKSPGVIIKDFLPPQERRKITSQTDLLLKFCESKVIGVTGTKGKSTVSSLIYHFLKSCEKDTLLIGNIGVPPLERMEEFSKETVVVCEMSCHQLEYVTSSPNISVLLNIYEEHLDHYVDFGAYAYAKENIYRFQGVNDTLIYNIEVECDEIKELSCNKLIASYNQPYDIYVSHNLNVIGTMIPVGELKTHLLGKHNIFNIGVALGAAYSVGCDINRCVESLPNFKGLEHRLERVAIINGVEFVNDSISTIPKTTIAAVNAFDVVDTLIIGGMDRGISYDELADFLNQGSVENLIFLPDSGRRVFEKITNPQVSTYLARDMADAVSQAKTVAKVRCILSPAAASYGFYKNFEERGEDFKKLVIG